VLNRYDKIILDRVKGDSIRLSEKMRIGIIGTGYVGLVTGACLADARNSVICADTNEKKITMLNEGKIPIYEPQLSEVLARCRDRMRFTTKIEEVVDGSEIIFICVSTPQLATGAVDLVYVEKSAREIAECMKDYKIIVDKSTVPIETGEKVKKTIRLYSQKGVDFDVVSNPEFLREGSAISDFKNPDRIVIGVESEKAERIMRKLYEPFDAPIIVTDIKSAELIKHASNSFLAMKISFINAISEIAEAAGADVIEVAKGMGADPRIGRSFLSAGIGYGGSCFPKDVAGFIHIAEKYGYDFKLLKAVVEINENQKRRFVSKVKEVLWVLNEKRIGVLGLSFKPNTDDMRNAPSIEIINALVSEGAQVKAYDPVAVSKAKDVLPKEVIYTEDPYSAADGAEALLILTEWDEIKKIDLEKIKRLLKNPIIIDGRNIFDPADMRRLGFEYRGMGR
jgi:UDPglucose 6-dehydrogenase